jgi:hypothetical protein
MRGHCAKASPEAGLIIYIKNCIIRGSLAYDKQPLRISLAVSTSHHNLIKF